MLSYMWCFVAFFCFFCLLYRTSQVFKFYAKRFISFGICIIAACFTLLNKNRVERFSFAAPYMEKLWTLFGIEFEVKGEHYLGIDGPAVIVCNHQSPVDHLFLIWIGLFTKRLLGAMGTNEIRRLLWLQKPSEWIGGVFIPLNDTEKAMAVLRDAITYCKENNTKLIIFPEGDWSPTGEMLEFRTGVFYLAVLMKMPIIPVVSGRHTFFNIAERRFDSIGKVHLRVLEPVPTVNLNRLHVVKLTNTIRDRMIDEFHKINAEFGLIK